MEMETVSAIIRKHGGVEALKADNSFYIRLEQPAFMRLVIEHVGEGPINGDPLISVAHYYEQNGDAMRDPEIVFEVGDDMRSWTPIEYQQDNLGIYTRAVFKDEGGAVKINPKAVGSITTFARTWDKNIKAQGFLEVENTVKKVEG